VAFEELLQGAEGNMVGGSDFGYVQSGIAQPVLDIRSNTQQQACFAVVKVGATGRGQPFGE
jgi:hypothetical protein